MSTAGLAPRTALFLPASNARAIEKARGLAADLLILDLEDAVRPEDKGVARDVAATVAFPGRSFAVRANGLGSEWHDADVGAIARSGVDLAVLPKVETAESVERFSRACGKPVLAMIETPAGVYAAREIAGAPGVAGLIVGTNDLRNALRIPDSAGREGVALALQAIVLAARAGGGWALDGVFNRLDDAEGLAAECAEGRMLGFDGKTLIHPNQIDIATRAFSPSEAEVEDARALIEAARGGAERFRDRMIEAMHVAQAEALLERA